MKYPKNFDTSFHKAIVDHIATERKPTNISPVRRRMPFTQFGMSPKHPKQVVQIRQYASGGYGIASSDVKADLRDFSVGDSADVNARH